MAKILIVDDDTRSADMLLSQLAALRHDGVVESKSQHVIDRLRHEKYDLLVLDVMLPVMSGFELCREIRRDSDFFSLPIMIVSAMNSDEEIMHGLAQGADDYIGKPFDMNKLLQRIESLLRTATDQSATDPITSMPASDSTKREIQKRIIEGQTLALAYVELTSIREFGYKTNAESRAKAIRHLARALEQVAKAMHFEDFFAGHMGNGHFVCILPPGQADRFCENTRQVWLTHLDQFYTSIGQAKAYEIARIKGAQSNGAIPLLDVLCCVTYRNGRSAMTQQRLFEVLSQVRYRAHGARTGGVFIDRRL